MNAAETSNIDGPSCPPRFWLEAFFAEEPVAPQMQIHFEKCPACSNSLQRLQAESSAYLLRARPPLDRLEPSRINPRLWTRPWMAAVAVPMAAALAWVLLPRDEVRLKGHHLQVVYHRGDQTLRYGPGIRLHPGDALRFVYAAPSDGSLLVLDVDATRSVQPFVPLNGAQSVPVKAGINLLPGSVALDSVPGPERLVVIFRPQSFSLDWAKQRLVLPGEWRPPELSCAECEVEFIDLQKEP